MPLEGTLSYLDIAHLLKIVGSSRKSGVLHIGWSERRARLLFQDGRLIRAESNRSHEGIGTLLVEEGLLAPEALERALAAQRGEGESRRLGALLCEDYGVRHDDIERLLSRQFEGIVFDLFSWPGGTFTFEFCQPDAVLDRFNLSPTEFILDVGLKAGLLAEQGEATEQGDPSHPPIFLLVRSPAVRERCRKRWQEKGHRVVCCEGPEELLDHLGERTTHGRLPVVMAELPQGPVWEPNGLGLLDAVRSSNAGALVFLLGWQIDAQLRAEAHRRGAKGFLRMPTEEEQRSEEAETRFDVFLMSLEKAVSQALSAVSVAKDAR